MGQRGPLVAVAAALLMMSWGAPIQGQGQPQTKPKQPQMIPSCLWRVFTAYPTPPGKARLCGRKTESSHQVAVLAGLAERLEARLTHIHPGRGHPATTLSLKVQLRQPTRNTPAVAVGIEDVFQDTGVGRAYYLVGSQSIPSARLRVHGGIWTDDQKTGLLLGAEHRFNSHFVLLADYHRDHVNAGIRYMVPDKRMLFELGVLDVGDKQDYVVGLRHQTSLW